MKSCVSCRFYFAGIFGSNFCKRSVVSKPVEVPDPIHGVIRRDVETFGPVFKCEDQRSRWLFGCGPKAKFHEPK